MKKLPKNTTLRKGKKEDCFKWSKAGNFPLPKLRKTEEGEEKEGEDYSRENPHNIVYCELLGTRVFKENTSPSPNNCEPQNWEQCLL